MFHPVRHPQPFDGVIEPLAGAPSYPHLHLQMTGMRARTVLGLTKYARVYLNKLSRSIPKRGGGLTGVDETVDSELYTFSPMDAVQSRTATVTTVFHYALDLKPVPSAPSR